MVVEWLVSSVLSGRTIRYKPSPKLILFLFLITFASSSNRDNVLKRGPWDFQKHWFALEPADPACTIHDYAFRYMCIWVRIHNIPLSLMTEALARTLGACVGKVVMTDTRLEDGNMGEFLCVRVSLDTTKPLRRCVTLSRSNAKAILCLLQYERIPIFCHGCGLIGHTVLQCPTTPQGDDQKLQYGAWLRAPLPKRVSIACPRGRVSVVKDADLPLLSPTPSVASSPPASASVAAASMLAPAASDAAAPVPVSAPVGPASSDAPVAAGRAAAVSTPLTTPSPRGKGRAITDNILVAHKLVHTLHTSVSRSSQGAIFKLDMEKAFDRVEWPFLKAVMLRLGFAQSWVDLIMRCVSSVSSRVRLRGTLSEAFLPRRGLRQGDPLSPFLFLFCTEGLLVALTAAQHEGHLPGVRASKHGPPVNHLLFADDNLVFLRNDIPPEYRVSVHEALGVQDVSDPGIYLMVPLLIGKNKYATFGRYRDKMDTRVSKWSNLLLSFSGREVLIKSFAQALPQYIRMFKDRWGGFSPVALNDNSADNEELPLRCRDFMVPGQPLWDRSKLSARLSSADVEKIMEVPISSGRVDTLIWGDHDLGLYTVRSGYLFLRRPSSPFAPSRALEDYGQTPRCPEGSILQVALWEGCPSRGVSP
ncbi:hypothetical protein GQ457_08G031750 [Hibiscus cannabinus]